MAKTVKKPLKKAVQENQSKVRLKRVLFLFLILAIAAAAIYVFYGYAYRTLYVQPREARIQEIYSTLNLSDDYQLTKQEVSGQKRVYEWDKSRSYSSVKEYVYAGTVSDTYAALDRSIKDAGYTVIGDPYPGSVAKQTHYKSSRGEYIRLTVDSKPRNDAFFNFTRMNPGKDFPQSLFDLDPNAGPAEVTIKVNLDDNNE